MRTRSRAPGDRGSVTVEAAISLSVLVVILALCLSGIGCAIAQLRCIDAAREAARLAARGDDDRVAAAVTSIAPAGAALRLDTDGNTVTATVSAGGVGGLLPGITVTARAVAVKEVGSDGPPG
jgi:hypothetical protein